MKSKSIIIVLCIVLVSCISCEKSKDVVLKEIGPVKVKSGQGFNMIPKGVSAMWANVENATPFTVIVWDGTELITSFKSSNFLTAEVPLELYSKPGKYEIYLFDKKYKKKSNSLYVVSEK